MTIIIKDKTVILICNIATCAFNMNNLCNLHQTSVCPIACIKKKTYFTHVDARNTVP